MTATESKTVPADRADRCCPMCGASVADGATECEACGESWGTASGAPRRIGIGGWLVPIAVLTVLWPISYFVGGWVMLLDLMIGKLGPSGRETWLVGFVIVQFAMTALSTQVALNFFRKGRQAPYGMMVRCQLDVVAAWVMFYVGLAVWPPAVDRPGPGLGSVLGTTVVSLGLITYFRTSQRVKDTFVN